MEGGDCITNSCVQIDEERDEVQANIIDMFESDNPLWNPQLLNILIGKQLINFQILKVIFILFSFLSCLLCHQLAPLANPLLIHIFMMRY